MTISKSKKIFAGIALIVLLSTSALVACSGRTVIDVNIDPTTGAGDIVINPPEEEEQPPIIIDNSGNQSDSNMSQVALFAVIVALLLGTAAIIISVARRPREG
jgi:hypothetical protein